MLKTNSKAARQNIMNYIRDDLEYLEERRNFNILDGAPVYTLDNDNNICAFIFQIYREEKSYERDSFTTFRDWCQGLPLGNLFCYYYNRSAVNDLGEILEETEEEKSRFTENQAENLLTTLIYREINKRKEKAEKPVVIELNTAAAETKTA